MHTLTIHTLPLSHPSHDHTLPLPRSKEALHILSDFISNFLSCDYCRKHFSEMSHALKTGSKVHHDGDAILWLWEAHNTVSERLIAAESSDPFFPKSLFPSFQTCPYCYQETVSGHADVQPSFSNTGFMAGESSLAPYTDSPPNSSSKQIVYVWNRTSVLLYLCNFYHLSDHSSSDHSHSRQHHFHPSEILEAAWPQVFQRLHNKYYRLGMNQMELDRRRAHEGVGFSAVDKGICIVSYLACFMFLALTACWLYRRKRFRIFF